MSVEGMPPALGGTLVRSPARDFPAFEMGPGADPKGLSASAPRADCGGYGLPRSSPQSANSEVFRHKLRPGVYRLALRVGDAWRIYLATHSEPGLWVATGEGGTVQGKSLGLICKLLKQRGF